MADLRESDDTNMSEEETTIAGTSQEGEGTVSRAELAALIDTAVERALAARTHPSGGAGQPPLGTMPPAEALQGMPVVSAAGPVSHSILLPPPLVPFTCPSGTSPAHTVYVGSSATPTVVAPRSTASPSPSASFGSASMLCNLLPTVGQTSEGSLSAGIYVGEGFLPVPAKLAEKITRWEFVEMPELLPEF